MTKNKNTHANTGKIGESSVFAQMVKNLQDPEFIKEMDKYIPQDKILTDEFEKSYEKYQQDASGRLIETNRSEKRQLLLEATSKLPSFKMSKEEFIKWLDEEY